MGTLLPGPSSWWRMDECMYSEGRPHTRSSSRYAVKGTVIHSFLADAQMFGRDHALARAHPDHQLSLSMIDLAELPAFDPKAYAPEVSFAWDIRGSGKVRDLGRNLHRDEARERAREDEVVGTADVVGLTPDAVVVYDYKTGYGHVERAEVNWQLRTYGFLAARKYQRERVIYGVIRVRDNGFPWFDKAEMDLLDLEGHEERSIELFERRDKVRADAAAGRTLPDPHEGEWCRYCPAAASCRAKVAGVQAILNAPPDLPLSAENAVRVYEKIKMAEQTLKRWKAAIKNIARATGGMPYGDAGDVLGLQKVIKDSLVAERVREPLAEFTENELVADAVLGEALQELKVITKKDFRAALNAHYLPLLDPADRKINVVNKAALDFLRTKGALTPAKTEEHLKVFKPGKAGEAPDPDLVSGWGEDLPEDGDEEAEAA